MTRLRGLDSGCSWRGWPRRGRWRSRIPFSERILVHVMITSLFFGLGFLLSSCQDLFENHYFPRLTLWHVHIFRELSKQLFFRDIVPFLIVHVTGSLPLPPNAQGPHRPLDFSWTLFYSLFKRGLLFLCVFHPPPQPVVICQVHSNLLNPFGWKVLRFSVLIWGPQYLSN